MYITKCRENFKALYPTLKKAFWENKDVKIIQILRNPYFITERTCIF